MNGGLSPSSLRGRDAGFPLVSETPSLDRLRSADVPSLIDPKNGPRRDDRRCLFFVSGKTEFMRSEYSKLAIWHATRSN